MIISFLRIISRSIISEFHESEITHILKVFSLRVSFPITLPPNSEMVDTEAWRAAVHEVTKSRTQLGN